MKDSPLGPKKATIEISHSLKGKSSFTVRFYRGDISVGTQEYSTLLKAKTAAHKFETTL
jgi:hypothetical protein